MWTLSTNFIGCQKSSVWQKWATRVTQVIYERQQVNQKVTVTARLWCHKRWRSGCFYYQKWRGWSPERSVQADTINKQRDGFLVRQLQSWCTFDNGSFFFFDVCLTKLVFQYDLSDSFVKTHRKMVEVLISEWHHLTNRIFLIKEGFEQRTLYALPRGCAISSCINTHQIVHT